MTICSQNPDFNMSTASTSERKGGATLILANKELRIGRSDSEPVISSSRVSESAPPAFSLEQITIMHPKVGISDFEILNVLGKGAYGKVYQVRKLSGQHAMETFAMKSVNKTRIVDSNTDLRHTRTERDVLALVDHPFLVKMYYAFETSRRLYFVQEFCRGGELFRLMETERMLMEDPAKFYICEIVCALEYLHSLNIVYRDLKTENIMLDEEGHIKLIDFGLSKIFESDEEHLTTTFCGTVEYMAPEVVIKNPGHGKPADWWSLGIFTFDLLTGRSPFHSNRGKKETKERIIKAKFTIPAFITPNAQDLIRAFLRKMVTRRLGSNRGAEEVKEHRFFEGINWDKVVQRGYKPPFLPPRLSDTDVSQFDPRFTSRTPKESECNPHPMDATFANLFPDFDFVAVDSDEDDRSSSSFSLSPPDSPIQMKSNASDLDLSDKGISSILHISNLQLNASRHHGD